MVYGESGTRPDKLCGSAAGLHVAEKGKVVAGDSLPHGRALASGARVHLGKRTKKLDDGELAILAGKLKSLLVVLGGVDIGALQMDVDDAVHPQATGWLIVGGCEDTLDGKESVNKGASVHSAAEEWGRR
jgi:hypothetical protein